MSHRKNQSGGFESPGPIHHNITEQLDSKSVMNNTSPGKSPFMTSMRSGNRSLMNASPCRSRMLMDPNERAQQDELSRQEYQSHLDELRNQEGVTEEDIEHFQKTVILKKCIDEVQKRYQDLDVIRRSPERYTTVQSKVKRCLQVQQQVINRKKSATRNNQASPQKQMNDSQNHVNSQLDVSQYGMNYLQTSQSPLKEKSAKKIQQREQEIRAQEEIYEQLKQEMEQKRQNDIYRRNKTSEKISHLESNQKGNSAQKNQAINDISLQQPKEIKVKKVEKQEVCNFNKTLLTSDKKELSNQKSISPLKGQKNEQQKTEKNQSSTKKEYESPFKKRLQSAKNTKQSETKTRNADKAFSSNKKSDMIQNLREVDDNQSQVIISRHDIDGIKSASIEIIERRNSSPSPNTIQVESQSQTIKIYNKSSQKQNTGIRTSTTKPANAVSQRQNNQSPAKATNIQNKSPERQIKQQKQISSIPQTEISQVQPKNKSPLKTNSAIKQQEQKIQTNNQTIVKKQKATGQNSGIKQIIDKEVPQPNNQSPKKQELPKPVQYEQIQINKDEVSSHDSFEYEHSSNNDEECFGKIAQYQTEKIRQDNKYQNDDLISKTNAIQEEFDKLMQEMLQKRGEKDPNGFYQIMDQFYGRTADDEKHASPTKRLIQHKNTAFEQKKILNDNVEKGQYQLTYTSSPGKSYIIEPHGGQLNYKLAEKDPLKFYDQVFTQDITQHKVKETSKSPVRRNNTLTSKVTKRPYVRMMEKIKAKIVEKLQEKIGQEFGDNILVALQDSNIDSSIKTLLTQKKLQLTDLQNNVIPIRHDSNDLEEEQPVSPDIRKTQLSIQTADFIKLEEKVRTHIEQNQQVQH